MKTLEDLLNYFGTLRKGDYQKNNFDSFLKEISFSFNFPAIHVAGTNGKGSTSNFIKNIYLANGYKVGYYHSPYLFSPCENICINDSSIDFDFFISKIEKYKEQIGKYCLSEFEIETFVAFEWFKENKVDIAIIECGMGGEYDATNIFTPVLSIITTISMEHTSFLGGSLSEIASHKAGIIKQHIPVLIGHIEGDALETIARKAKECEAPITSPIHLLVASNNFTESIISYPPYFEKLSIHFLPDYLIKDLEIAITASLILKENFPIKNDKWLEAFKMSKLPARFEIIEQKPLILVDGSHNPEGIEALYNSIESLNFQLPIHIIYASFKDKNINSIFPILGRLTTDIKLTTFDHVRARIEDEYFLYLGDYNFYPDFKKLIDDTIKEYPDDMILITGSLAFAGQVLKYLKSNKYDFNKN